MTFIPLEQRKQEREFYDSQPMRSTCLFCEWSIEGRANEVRNQALAHRQEKHSETFKRRRSFRSRRALSTFRYVEMDNEERDEVEQERRRRAYLIGIEIDE